MTDRELLALAARAAGIDLTPMAVKPLPPREDDGFIGYMTNAEQWPRGWFNPLTDDGDALRLAVKLGTFHTLILEVGCSGADCEFNHKSVYGHELIFEGIDPYAATRRAIVRAAAEIGRSMK